MRVGGWPSCLRRSLRRHSLSPGSVLLRFGSGCSPEIECGPKLTCYREDGPGTCGPESSADRACGAHAGACDDGETCLEIAFCCDLGGVCVTIQERARICECAPAAFDCG
ncbi:MAG: hypothetical protein HYY06_22150 [Deltaproteobacteria bacterium]|nr:hypothetical protein [Deltaproteobacteria bacterium]